MSPRTAKRAHLVRPRWVWTGVVLGLLGAGLVALWIAVWWLPAGIAGLVLIVLAAAAGLRGGILYDTHGSRAVTHELDEVRHPKAHRGTAPGDMVTDERLRAEARETSRMTTELLHATEAAPRPAYDMLGGALLLGAAVFLVLMQGIYPHTHTGQDNALRSLLLAVVIALAALRVLLGQQPGPAPSAVAGLCGVALILFATLTDHDRDVTMVLEIVVGAWVLLMSLLTFDHPPHVPATEPPGRGDARGRSRPHLLGAHAAEDVRIAAVALAISAALVGLFRLGRRAAGHARNTPYVE